MAPTLVVWCTLYPCGCFVLHSDICDRIVAMCESQRKPFFDRDFWYGDRSTMYPKGTPSDCTVTEPRRAVRATELYPKVHFVHRSSLGARYVASWNIEGRHGVHDEKAVCHAQELLLGLGIQAHYDIEWRR